jgi:hypothetical protein
VPNDVGTISSMEIDVLVAIYVPYMGAFAMANPHRDWT